MERGTLNKMLTTIEHNTVQYTLELNRQPILVNSLLNKHIQIDFTGSIFCISCGAKTSKSFAQGYCYRCFTTSPYTEECVLRPELCQAHNGIARDMEYAQNHCLIPHYVYIAETSDIKVGVTRNTQIPTRWIDQGAIQARIIAQTPNRYIAGTIEVALKNHIADKTNWRKMLTKITAEYDLNQQTDIIHDYIQEFSEYLIQSPIQTIHFPGEIPQEKIHSVKLDTSPQISGILKAIKGQYLIFETGQVCNIRSHSGYEINLSYTM